MTTDKRPPMIDEGIFKTGRTVLFGGRRVDIQWLHAINERAKRLEQVSRPPRRQKKQDDDSRQLLLPGIRGCR